MHPACAEAVAADPGEVVAGGVQAGAEDFGSGFRGERAGLLRSCPSIARATADLRRAAFAFAAAARSSRAESSVRAIATATLPPVLG